MIMAIIIATLLGLFVFGMAWSVYLMVKPSITCPACQRKFKGAGRQLKCYKCGTNLSKNANGHYTISKT